MKIASQQKREKQRRRTHENKIKKYVRLLKLFGESKIWREKLQFSRSFLGKGKKNDGN